MEYNGYCKEKSKRYWKEMLGYLQENWENINNLPIEGFNEYIKASYQQIYYSAVYEKIENYNFEQCDIDKLVQDMNNVVDNLGVNAEFTKLDSREKVEKIIYVRGKIIVHQFRKAVIKKYPSVKIL